MSVQRLKTLDRASAAALLTFNRGIEREALRIDEGGLLARSGHPSALGSKLTHPKITTDFSEAQLELITPVHQSATSALADLDQIHRYLYTLLGDELLWAASMPCLLPEDENIPLAYYGPSNLGQLKTTYRSGLGYRYGRAMQTICAVHYNFSFGSAFWQWLKSVEQPNESDQQFVTRRYFDLTRNFRRWSWLLTYLFGASPAVCESFLQGHEHGLQTFDETTAYLPYATSLRSGNLGYQSDAQAEHMKVCYNSLDSYVSSLAAGICDQYPPYEKIGVLVEDAYRQINASILQSEAEFYSSIRAKRVPGPGENQLACLRRDGVQYLEVRLLDVNPYLPLGIDESEIDFLDTFLLYCILNDSPTHDDLLCNEVRLNAMATVNQGRQPQLSLQDNGTSRTLQEWGEAILTGMSPYADILDQTFNSTRYCESLGLQKQRLVNPDTTPSGQLIREMENGQTPFLKFAMNQTLKHRELFKATPLEASEAAFFDELARQSLVDQEKIESSDTRTFDQYLADTLAVYQQL